MGTTVITGSAAIMAMTSTMGRATKPLEAGSLPMSTSWHRFGPRCKEAYGECSEERRHLVQRQLENHENLPSSRWARRG